MSSKGWERGLASLALPGLVLLFAPVAVAGQAVTTGTVVVQAMDGTGAVLPGVTVTLLDVDTGVVRTAVVEQGGNALFLNVPVANNYELTAELQGFTTRKIERIKVDPGATRSFKIVMELGGVAETVTVLAELQLVDTKSAAPRETMDSKLAESAPLMARNQAELASLFPAVLQTTADNSPTFVQFHVRGQATTGHGYRQDGADTMTPYLGRTGSTLSPASIERIEFVSGGMPPEYGEQPGGVFNIVTKSGTNKVTGAYSFLYRDDRFNSKVVSGIPGQVLDSTPGDTHFEEAVFGAPLKRDKAFLFVTYQFRGEDVGNILSRNIREGDHHNIHAKINIAQNPSNQWVIQTDLNTVRQDNTSLSSTVSAESQGGQDVNIMFGSVTQTHQFNPSTVLESQGMYYYLYQQSPIMHYTYNPQVTTVSQSGSYTTGMNATLGGWLERRVKGSVKLTKVFGNHTFKAGADYSYYWGERHSAQLVPIFSDRRPIGGVLTRTDNFYRSPYPLDDRLFAAFVQDQWTVRDRLTLVYGLRTDYQRIVGDHIVQPRVGLSYDPLGDGRNKLSASWGLMHQVVPGTAYSVEILELQRLVRVAAPVGSFVGPETIQNEFRVVRTTDLKNPRTRTGTISYERALPFDTRATATFAWSQIRDRQIATTYTNRTEYATGGKTDYKGLELSVRKFLTHRFQVLGAYTWSRTDGDTESSLTLLQTPYRYALMDYDSPHSARVTATFLLPGNVDVSGIFKYVTGRPYSVNNAQVGTAVAYVDKQGNPAGRNIYRMPDVYSFDFGVARDFRVGRTTLHPMLQVLNLTNKVNVLSVQSVFTAAGQPTRVDTGRQVQFGVDVRF